MIYTPSLACADQLNLEKDIRQLLSVGITMFHFDIMDGHYVPNLCLNVDTAKQLRERFPDIAIDAHIMVTDPDAYIDRLKDAGVDLLAFHISSTNFAHRTVTAIKQAGMKAGIVINPSESLSLIKPVLDMVDYVLVMSIEPGFSGQKFIESSYEKIERLAVLRKEKKLSFQISVDGGITPDIGKKLKKLGADMLVLGYPAVFRQPDGIEGSFARFKNCVEG